MFIYKQDGQESFNLTVAPELLSSHHLTPTSSVTSVLSDPTTKEETSGSLLPPKEEMWISIQADEKYTESLVPIQQPVTSPQRKKGAASPVVVRGHWKSFIDGLQRVLVFTRDEDVIDRIQAADTISKNNVEMTLTFRSVGVSLVDNKRKREVAFIGITQ